MLMLTSLFLDAQVTNTVFQTGRLDAQDHLPDWPFNYSVAEITLAALYTG